MKKKVLIVSIPLFVLILILVLMSKDIFIDKVLYNFMTSIKCNSLTEICKLISVLCTVKFLLPFSLILFIVIKNKKIPMCIISNLGIIAILNQVIKALVKRARPIYGLIIEDGYSFPSGHSMVSFAFYGLLIYFVYKYIKNKNVKTFLYIFLSFIIFAIGFSRIYLGVHYATDVLGAYLLSLIYLMIFIHLIEKYMLNDKTTKAVIE